MIYDIILSEKEIMYSDVNIRKHLVFARKPGVNSIFAIVHSSGNGSFGLTQTSEPPWAFYNLHSIISGRPDLNFFAQEKDTDTEYKIVLQKNKDTINVDEINPIKTVILAYASDMLVGPVIFDNLEKKWYLLTSCSTESTRHGFSFLKDLIKNNALYQFTAHMF